MAEKSFGIKEINLIGASGTPTIESPNNLNLNAVNVAISTNVSIGGTLTVTGNVSVGGTLTYEDVTNIDSVGIITARSGIKVSAGGSITIGTGVTFESNGQAAFVGVITASKFVGDGSDLSGVSGGGFSQDAEGNLVAGTNAGEDLASGGTYNVLIGEDAGKQLTTQDYNVYIGKQAGENAVNTYGSNIGIGYQALQAGNQNSSVYSVAIGYQAGYYKPKFSGCTFIGYVAGAAYMSSSQTAQDQTFIGYGSGYNCKLGRSVGVGVGALYNGDYAFDSRCTAIGWQAGYNNSSGVSNTYVGARAGYTVTSGQKNTLLGKDAGGTTLATGDNNIIIGNEADASASGVDNEITLGDTNITTLRVPGIGVSFSSTTGNSFSSDGQFVSARWTVANNGSSNYTFTGPGGLSAASNSTLYLARGQTYEFNMNASGHGFGIQTSSGGWNASNEYTTGITNAKAAVGVIKFEVPFSAPNTLYYACTAGHSGMVGSIVVYPSI